MRQKLSEEKGQVLLLALIALAVGALLVSPFLARVSTSLIASRISGESLAELYAADAAVEDAIWNIRYGDLATTRLMPGDSTSYPLNQSVNDLTPNVTITRDNLIIASDDFESGNWSGGSGWLDPWYHTGSVSITPSQSPRQSHYHLCLQSHDGYAKRAADLSGQSNLRLQFWAKVRSFENGDSAACLISADGSNWTTVKTWTVADSDDIYRFVDIDLSSYTMSSEFWIAFDANMSEPNDYLYIDDLAVVRLFPSADISFTCDDFESEGWSGGGGWLYPWYHTGSADVKPGEDPHQGNYHLRLKKSGYVKRATNLSGESSLKLQLWAKVGSFESGDSAACLISSDGSNWTTVKTWTAADSNDTYHFVDIDLSPYTMSSEFWIAFDADMSSSSANFFVDDLRIVGPLAYEIVASAGDKATRAYITIQSDEVIIHSWQIE